MMSAPLAGPNDPAARRERPQAGWSAWTLLYRWRWVVLAFASSRLITLGVMKLSQMIIVGGEYWNKKGGVYGALTSWNGKHYLEVANEGYSYAGDLATTLGFFPLYPAFTTLASLLTQDTGLAAIIVSNIALLVAGILLSELVEEEYERPRLSRMAVMFLMFSPVSFFFSSAYAESTFLALSLGAWLAALRSRWAVAALCGIAAAATHSIGFLLVVPLLIESQRQRQKPAASSDSRRAQGALLVALIPLGCIFHLLYAQVSFGDFLAPLRAAELWERGVELPWQAVDNAETPRRFYIWFTTSMLFAAVALVGVGAWLKLRASYLVYAALLVGLYAFSSSLPSIARYVSVVFPLFVALALLCERYDWLYEPLLACSFTALAFCSVLSANGYWMR